MERIPMQFWTKLVKSPNDLTLWLPGIGGIILLLSVMTATILEKQGTPVYGIYGAALGGMCVLLIGLILSSGKRSRRQVLNTDIIISSEEIRIGDLRFVIDQVQYLDFLVNSYNGMAGPRLRFRRMILDGLDNKLYFTADGKKHTYGFYLEDSMAMRRLGMLFRELYEKPVRFRERNRGGRTFLFEQVMDRKQFEEAKRKEGYA